MGYALSDGRALLEQPGQLSIDLGELVALCAIDPMVERPRRKDELTPDRSDEAHCAEQSDGNDECVDEHRDGRLQFDGLKLCAA
jgi:hypothetical protein